MFKQNQTRWSGGGNVKCAQFRVVHCFASCLTKTTLWRRIFEWRHELVRSDNTSGGGLTWWKGSKRITRFVSLMHENLLSFKVRLNIVESRLPELTADLYAHTHGFAISARQLSFDYGAVFCVRSNGTRFKRLFDKVGKKFESSNFYIFI